MTLRSLYSILLLSFALMACQPRTAAPSPEADKGPAPSPTALPSATPRPTSSPTPRPRPISTFTPAPPTSTPTPTYRVPPQQASWQIQFTGPLQLDLPVQVFDLDLFDTPPEVIARLHQRSVYVMCYFSAGTWEEWRPDADAFPQEVLGKPLEDWPGERWMDIRRLDVLAPIMEARMDLAREKGCDGVDPDNVDGYTNDTGFPLTLNDQLAYNRFLAQAAHARGLAVGLKNDLEQIPQLLPDFDWALNEECFTYDECELLLPFVEAGKPVFVIEYELDPEDFCPQANALGFNALLKRWELDAFRVDCREFTQNR